MDGAALTVNRTRAFTLSAFVCTAIIALQTAFIFMPGDFLNFFNQTIRIMVYVTLVIVVYSVTGIDRRTVRKAYQSNLVAVISTLLYAAAFIILIWMFGGGNNAMAARSIHMAFRWFWEIGMIVILSEMIRYKLIKSAVKDERNTVALMLALVFALGYMGHGLWAQVRGSGLSVPEFVFNTALMPLVISCVASFFAMEGSFVSVISIPLVHLMVPRYMPVLPNVGLIAFSLVFCGVLVASAVIYNLIMNDASRAQKLRVKRLGKYENKVFTLFNAATVAVLGVIVAFFLNAFPIYPLVILTDSMSGTIDRGSLVFVQRVPEGRAEDMVGEGYIIHFLRGIEYVHRTVEFRHGADGRREYITQGDANERPDPFFVTQDDVLGIARSHLPFLGWPYIFFRALFQAF